MLEIYHVNYKHWQQASTWIGADRRLADIKCIVELEKERDECAIVISTLVRAKDVDLSGICSTADKALLIRDLRQQAKGVESCRVSRGFLDKSNCSLRVYLREFEDHLNKQADELEQSE